MKLFGKELSLDESKVSVEQVKNFADILVGVAKKVNPVAVVTWSPEKTLWFGTVALRLFLKNKKVAKQQAGELKTLLNKNGFCYDAAMIAEDVYGTKTVNLTGGWKRSDESVDGVELCAPSCGLVSGLYYRQKDEFTDYVYAIAGTDPKNTEDWKANLEQLYGESEQYKVAARNAKLLSDRFSGNNASITYVGHSLGGGIATYNALSTGHKAIVFNPAGLSDDTMKSCIPECLGKAEELITSFVSFNDVLNWSQDTSQHFFGMKQVIPASIGKRYYLYNKGVYPFKSHTIGQMIANLDAIKNL